MTAMEMRNVWLLLSLSFCNFSIVGIDKKMDIFIFGVITLSTLLLLTMLGLGYYENRATKWMYLVIGILACLLVYLAFALTKSTHVVGHDGILNFPVLFF